MAPIVTVLSTASAPGALSALVSVDPARLRTRDVPGLSERSVAALPLLVRHSCDNSAGAAFREELADTEIAHLLEHVAVELLARGAPQRGCRGETSWDFARDGAGVFKVTVRHDDAGAAKAAMECATAALCELAEGAAPDVARLIAAVRAARGGRAKG